MLLKNCFYYDGKEFKEADISINNGIIKEIKENIVTDKDIFDASGYFVLPGMINTHSHLPMTLMRGIADSLELRDWLFKVIFPIENKFIDEKFIEFGTTLGIIEMIKNGITSSVEMYYLPKIMAKTFKKYGFRGYIGIGSGDESERDKKKAVDFIENFKNDELITPSPFAHAIYTTNEKNLIWVKELSDKYNLPYQFHLLETQEENKNFFKKKHKNLLPYLRDLGFLSNRLIAAHSVWLSDEDIDILSEFSVTVSHNPGSNLKLNSGIMKLRTLVDKGVNITIGTDGAASNNSLSLLAEMNLAAKLHYIKSSIPAKVSEIFDMVTKNPSKILDGKIGTIKVGNKADLIFLKKRSYSMLPGFNPISNLVYSLPSEAVDSVMINGVFVMKNRKLTMIEEDDFYRELEIYLQKIDIRGYLNKI